jgi:hypothetical protein
MPKFLNLKILVPDDDECENDRYKCPMLFKPLNDNGECKDPVCNAFRIELQQYSNGGLSTLKCEKCLNKAIKL